MIIKWIWKIWKKKLIAYYVSAENAPLQLTELEYAFTDLNAKKYYRYTRPVNMSIDRVGKLQEYMIWMSRALTGEQLDELFNLMLKHIDEGIKFGDNAAKVASIAYEIKLRKESIFPVSLLYNYLAVQYVREDENPQTFNEKIHDEKVEQFSKEHQTNSSFFFRAPELTTLQGWSNITETEYKQRLEKLMTEESRINQRAKIFA